MDMRRKSQVYDGVSCDITIFWLWDYNTSAYFINFIWVYICFSDYSITTELNRSRVSQSLKTPKDFTKGVLYSVNKDGFSRTFFNGFDILFLSFKQLLLLILISSPQTLKICRYDIIYNEILAQLK